MTKTFPAFVAAFILLGMIQGCAEEPMNVESDQILGEVRGSVLEIGDQTPIVGARVSISPGNRMVHTSSTGSFSFTELPLTEHEPTVYTVSIDRPGFESRETTVMLSRSGPVAEMNLLLTPVVTAPGGEGGGGNQSDGALIVQKGVVDFVPEPDGPRVTFEVSLSLEGSASAESVVIRDTLDPGFAILRREDITVDQRFPGATVTLDPESRSFTVDVGVLSPTQGFIRVFTVTTRGPTTSGIWCNRVFLTAILTDEPVSQSRVACYV